MSGEVVKFIIYDMIYISKLFFTKYKKNLGDFLETKIKEFRNEKD